MFGLSSNQVPQRCSSDLHAQMQLVICAHDFFFLHGSERQCCILFFSDILFSYHQWTPLVGTLEVMECCANPR